LHRLATIHPLQRTTDDDGRQPCKTPTALLYRINNICRSDRQRDRQRLKKIHEDEAPNFWT